MHTRTLFVLPFAMVALVGCARGLDFGRHRNPDGANPDAGSSEERDASSSENLDAGFAEDGSTELDGSRNDSGVVGPDDPCIGVTCDSPPAATCVDANTLRAYDMVGECNAGECSYVERDIACANCPSCDACAGVMCNTPPAATCASAGARRTYASSGMCEAGSCDYAPIDIACNTPPAATCADASMMRTYASSGTCTAGTCNYTPIDTACNTPPAATCVDANTLRTYAPSGTCAGGTCTYSSTDTPCLFGCSAGRCAAEGRTFDAYLKASNTGVGDEFGASVSLSGDLLAVGAYWEDSSATGVNGDQADNSARDSGAVYIFRRSATGSWTQEAYLKASNTDASDSFGVSVSLSGDLLAVGAHGEDSAATGVNGDQANNSARDSGAVYIFRRSDAGSWTQEAYLKASNTGADDRFGISVSLSGDLLAVGAHGEDSAADGVNSDQTNNSAENSGAVYVIRRSDAGSWTQEAYLKASNTGAFDVFGSSVSLSGDLLAVGAYGENSSATGVNGSQFNNSANDSGAAYVFRRSATGSWAQEAYLKASNTDAEDRFGISVSLSGDLLAVGAYVESSSATGVDGDQANNSASQSGAVYVFRRSATGSWTQEAYLKASNAGGGDRFGSSVSLSGDLLAVGAPGESSSATGVDGDQTNNSATRSGAVYVFRRSAAGSWTQEAYLKASNTGVDDQFGSAVSLSGSLLAVGAYGEDSSTTGVNGNQDNEFGSHSGAVYVYR